MTECPKKSLMAVESQKYNKKHLQNKELTFVIQKMSYSLNKKQKYARLKVQVIIHR